MNIPWQTSSRFIQHAYPLLMGISPRVMCVVCGGGCGYVLVPRDVRLIKETNRKQLIMSAHLCSCWLVFSFWFICLLFSALFCSFCSFLLFLLFLAHISVLFASSGLSLAFWIFFFAHVCSFWVLFLFIFVFICLGACSLLHICAHVCSCLLNSALCSSLALFCENVSYIVFYVVFWWKYM